VVGYVRAREEREEEAEGLQASIHHAHIEISNLSRRRGDDYPLKDLYRMLVFEVELSKGTLQRQTTAVR
jgi:hypothetical protein